MSRCVRLLSPSPQPSSAALGPHRPRLFLCLCSSVAPAVIVASSFPSSTSIPHCAALGRHPASRSFPPAIASLSLLSDRALLSPALVAASSLRPHSSGYVLLSFLSVSDAPPQTPRLTSTKYYIEFLRCRGMYTTPKSRRAVADACRSPERGTTSNWKIAHRSYTLKHGKGFRHLVVAVPAYRSP